MPKELDLEENDITKITAIRDKKVKQRLKIGELVINKYKLQEMINKIDGDTQKELRQEEVYIQEERELIDELSEKYGHGQADLDRKKFIQND